MKMHGKVETYIHVFLTSALNRSESMASHPSRLINYAKALRYTLNKGLGGPLNRSGSGKEERRLSAFVNYKI
jgi:hypothetical protein